MSGQSAEKDVTCGKHFGRHPSRPELVSVCTLPADHDGDCDNVLSKSGAPSAEKDAGVSGAAHRFNNALRYRDDSHEMQRQLTPPYVLDPVRRALGGIELDPCTEPDNPTGAERFYTATTDGAEEPWDAATIYVNPPYSKARERWVARCIEAAESGARVVLLMPSHTDTRLFHRAIQTASHVVFIKGRVKFGVLRENRRQEAASHPSCLIAWNLTDASALAPLGAVWCVPSPAGGAA